MRKKIFGQEIKIDEHKTLQLEILKYVTDFCEQHNLRYFLADGTLLGAVRHHGFIPWDDDIDIRMPRPDYMRLIEIFNTEVSDSNYKLIDPKSDIAQHYMIKVIDTRTIKIEPHVRYSHGYLGVDIDIFPLEGAPNTEEKYQEWIKPIRAYNKAYVYKKKTFWRKILSTGKDILSHRDRAAFVPFLSCKEILDQNEKRLEEYPYDKSNYISAVGVVDCYRVNADAYREFTYMYFEGFRFRVPIGYDAVLKSLYGDYMTLPPIEEQISRHTNKVYWK